MPRLVLSGLRAELLGALCILLESQAPSNTNPIMIDIGPNRFTEIPRIFIIVASCDVMLISISRHFAAVPYSQVRSPPPIHMVKDIKKAVRKNFTITAPSARFHLSLIVPFDRHATAFMETSRGMSDMLYTRAMTIATGLLPACPCDAVSSACYHNADSTHKRR